MLSTVAIEKNLAELHIIKEMVSTESSYNKSLELLDSAFSKDDSVQNSQILMQFKSIISAFKNISDQLLVNANKVLNEAISPEECVMLKIERAQLMKAFFHAYQSYPALYNVYLVDCKSSPLVFETLNARILQDTTLGLANLLIQPIQRGIRYEMLIEQLLKQSADLPDNTVTELKEILLFITKSIEAVNSVTEEIQPQKQASYQIGDFTRYYFFGKTRNVETPVIQENEVGYKVGDMTRYLAHYLYEKFSVSEDNIFGSMEEASSLVIFPDEQSVKPGLEINFSGPPTDLPPQLPDELIIESDLSIDNSQPPTYLPPELPVDDSKHSLENENSGTFSL